MLLFHIYDILANWCVWPSGAGDCIPINNGTKVLSCIPNFNDHITQTSPTRVNETTFHWLPTSNYGVVEIKVVLCVDINTSFIFSTFISGPDDDINPTVTPSPTVTSTITSSSSSSSPHSDHDDTSGVVIFGRSIYMLIAMASVLFLG